jgi:hypothetical protein
VPACRAALALGHHHRVATIGRGGSQARASTWNSGRTTGRRPSKRAPQPSPKPPAPGGRRAAARSHGEGCAQAGAGAFQQVGGEQRADSVAGSSRVRPRHAFRRRPPSGSRRAGRSPRRFVRASTAAGERNCRPAPSAALRSAVTQAQVAAVVERSARGRRSACRRRGIRRPTAPWRRGRQHDIDGDGDPDLRVAEAFRARRRRAACVSVAGGELR